MDHNNRKESTAWCMASMCCRILEFAKFISSFVYELIVYLYRHLSRFFVMKYWILLEVPNDTIYQELETKNVAT